MENIHLFLVKLLWSWLTSDKYYVNHVIMKHTSPFKVFFTVAVPLGCSSKKWPSKCNVIQNHCRHIYVCWELKRIWYHNSGFHIWNISCMFYNKSAEKDYIHKVNHVLLQNTVADIFVLSYSYVFVYSASEYLLWISFKFLYLYITNIFSILVNQNHVFKIDIC